MAAEQQTRAGGSEDIETAVFQQHRDVLMGVAYRMLGRVADAEDVVQDAWLRWSAADTSGVADPRAYLVRITTRLAIDRLRQVQSRREAYVGPWLPEPILTDLSPAPDSAERVVLAESVSLGLMVLLESLSPLERAVFVLREAFDYPHAEIAAVLGRSEAAVRQLAARARAHIQQRRPRFEVDDAERRRLTEQFLTAASAGDVQGLLGLLAPDAELVGDGGGKAKAPLRVIRGSDKIARFLAAVAGRPLADPGFSFVEANGVPALLVTSAGVPTTLVSLDVADGRVTGVYLVTNPDKLVGLQLPPAAAQPRPQPS